MDKDSPFELTEANVQRLKEKYSKEMKDDAANPIKVCMKLIFEAAIEKNLAKREQLANELSKFLIQPSGVINLFLTVIDFDTSSQKVTTLNQRFMAISNIITCLPRLAVPYPEYCDNISKQLQSFLVSDNPKYSSLSCIIVKSMLESPHAKGKPIEKIILDPIRDAISSPGTTNAISLGDAIVIVHNLLQNHLPPTLFVELFPSIFYAALVCDKTPSHLKKYLKFILKCLLNELKPGPACCLLEETIFYKRDHCVYQPIEEENAITLQFSESAQDQVDFDDMKDLMIDLLKHCDNRLLILEFFFKFQAKIWTSNNETIQQESASLIEPLLIETMGDGSNSLDILSSMVESENALELISRTLMSYVESLRLAGFEPKARELADSSINSCLSILEVLSMSICDKRSSWTLYNRILPSLSEAKLLLEQREKTENHTLLDKFISLIDKLKDDKARKALKEAEALNLSQVEYFKAMKDLNDKLVPVRVHGLVSLKNLVMADDQFTVSEIPHLYDLLESSLADQESYVFLACINLMAEMSVRRTKEILPKLIDLYFRQDLGVQQRINAGEVLVRLARQLNKTTPYYVKDIMNMLIMGTKDADELMRMSSLASIGEICHQLGFSLSKYITDILSCIEEIINFDTVQVKCAAVNLLRLTLMGVDRSIVDSIQSEMRSMYKLLKRVKAGTLDDKLRLQVDLALDEVDRLAKEILVGQ